MSAKEFSTLNLNKRRAGYRRRGEAYSLHLRVVRILVAMDRWSAEHRAFAVEAYFKNNDSPVAARRIFARHFNIRRIRDCPSTQLIGKWVRSFREQGPVVGHGPGVSRTVRTDETIEAVRRDVIANPRLSLRKRSAALNLKKTTVHKIIKKDLEFHPYKIQITQKIKQSDYGLRLTYARTMLGRFPRPRGYENIIFSDEAHFLLDGSVNKQNCRYWATENPEELHEKPLHSEKVTVWCGINAKGIIGPYFFEDDRHQTITVNSQTYSSMLENFLEAELENNEWVNGSTWFQQDGATPHTSRASMNIVRRIFPEKVISRYGDIPWPPRSPDLTPADFFYGDFLNLKSTLTNREIYCN